MEQRESNALMELQNRSCSPYTTFLAGPGGSRLTGWNTVRPCAEYNLTARPPGGPCKKPHKEHKGHKTRPPPASPPSYMSGVLDENYSYVYKAGLSKRCRKDISRHSNPSQQSSPKVFSTVYLDPIASQPPLLRQMEAQLQSDLARIVAMQMKPELLLEQIIIENRLRNMGCLQAPSLHNIRSLNLEGVGVDPKAVHCLDKGTTGMWHKSEAYSVQSKSAPSLIGHQPQPATKVKKKRQKALPSLEWCSLHRSNTDITALEGSMYRTNGAIIAAARREVTGMSDLLSVKTHPSSKSTVTDLRQTNHVPCHSDVTDTSFRLPSLVPHALRARNHLGESQIGAAGVRVPNHVTFPVVSPSLEEHYNHESGAMGRGEDNSRLAKGKEGQFWHQPKQQQKTVRSLT